MSRTRRGAAAWLAAVAFFLTACGGSSTHSSDGTNSSPGDTVDIYSSLPLHGVSGAQGRAIVAGILLALRQRHGRAGQSRVRYQSLDDSGPRSGEWDLNRTVADAHRAASDPGAVYYIGEFDSAASEISIPILNQAGVAQVSPSNTYVGLTTSDPGSAADEPQRFYPTSGRTYLRIMPRDTVQAAAGLLAMEQAGCTRVAVAYDQGAYGAEWAQLLDAQKGDYGLRIVSIEAISQIAAGSRSYALGIRDHRADCLFLAGAASGGSVLITREVHLAIPSARIFGGPGTCTNSFTNGEEGGVGAAIDPLIECTRLPQRLTAYPGGRAFLAAFRARYGGATPDGYAIYGYEAMNLGLASIAALGPQAGSKPAMLQALHRVSNRHSVLGTYGFDRSGDTTLRAVGLYGVGRQGNPVFMRTLVPSKVR